MAAGSFTKSMHSKPYAAISPLQPELSQAGKTVLITGGNAGIGFAIGRAFGQASAAKVILLGRREEATKAAAAELSEELRKQQHDTEVIGLACDVVSSEDVERVWAGLEKEGTVVDVLVLNAAKITEWVTLLDRGTKSLWEDYTANLRSHMDFTERFYKQTGTSVHATKHLINVSTLAIHDWTAPSAAMPAYGVTKTAAAALIQIIAKDTPPEKMQVVSFHPGTVLTQNARDAGYTETDFDWNDPNLAGQFAVWAASAEARFLHGRFVWCNWDVDELKTGEIRKRIDEDNSYLKVGVLGL